MKLKSARLAWLAAAAAMLFAVALPGTARAAEPVELKLATLAPKGSAWAKVLEKGGKDIETQTQGRVKVKYFFSGQQGDERDVVRKMTSGNLDGGVLTAVGLGLIKGDVRVLELPFLFTNDKQLDFVRDAMKADFEAQFDSAGYVLLAWGDVGWTHIYTNIEINSKADLAKTKMWAWKDDPIVRTLFKGLGINGVPLGVPDVYPQLQTGGIDACYGSPLAAVALQWYTKVKFATNTPISYAIGAMIVRKDVFSKLSADDQKVIRASSAVMGGELLKMIRKDNERAKKAMQKSGVKFVDTPAALVTELQAEGQKVWKALVGSLYQQGMLDKVLKLRGEALKKYP
jgi:TRAP-type C4-dicarboxylate transport system substrate-binding protein